MRTSLVLAVFGIGLGACGNDIGTDDPPPPEDLPRVSWYQDVAPMLAKHCMGCHQDGGIAPFSLTEYETAVESSARVIEAIEDGIMPPFDAREEADCTPRFGWQDDPRLSTEEKNTLHTWIEDGHPLGTKADFVIPAVPELENVTTTLTPAQGFTTSGTRDQFVCFLLDPGNGPDLRWLTGLQVRPGNDLVVHHAVITQVMQAEADPLVAERGVGVPWECEQTPGNFTVHVWTPGNQPMKTPAADLAVPILPNSKFVMQIHYHPAEQINDVDFTSIDLQYSTQWPRKMYFVFGAGNEVLAPNLEPGPGDLNGVPMFLIPPNAADHPENMSREVATLGNLTNVKLYSVNPHMHLIGTHISSKIVRPAARANDPQTECIANGGWNFDWQRTYTYDAPVDSLPSLAVGDRIEVSCTWNNTIANPFVERMLHDAMLPPVPIPVTLGEQTTNEMCLEIFGIAADAPPPPPVALQASYDLVLPDMDLMFAR